MGAQSAVTVTGPCSAMYYLIDTDANSWRQEGEHWLLSQNQCGFWMQFWDPLASKSRGHSASHSVLRCSFPDHREGRKECDLTDWAFYIKDNAVHSLKYGIRLRLPDWNISITPYSRFSNREVAWGVVLGCWQCSIFWSGYSLHRCFYLRKPMQLYT